MAGVEVSGMAVWNRLIKAENIPGSTRVPVSEIFRYFDGKINGLRGLDLGSGRGRSTKILTELLPGSSITALDLSHSGLKLTEVHDRVQGRAEELPFLDGSFDFVNVCGVMTNIVNIDPAIAREMRKKVLSNLYSIIKPGGCVVISDFGAEHLFDGYGVNYVRHFLITGEMHTIAVLKSGENFAGKSDNDVVAMRGTGAIERYAHHYTLREMTELLKNAGFNVCKCSIETTETPVGKKTIENIIVLAEKPKTIVGGELI